jgi:hypothetical protein
MADHRGSVAPLGAPVLKRLYAMISLGLMLAQLFITLAALVGLARLMRVLKSQGEWDPINRRFLFGLRVVTAIFIGRALVLLTGIEAFRGLVLIGGGLIPLAVLVLTEGLLRRHAPALAKRGVAVLTVGFVVSGFWVSDSIDPIRIYGLLIFQTFGLCLSGWLVLTRDRDRLSASENSTVERLGLSLLVLIPLVAADFLMDILGIPLQISALGVLFLCWLAISLGRAGAGHTPPLIGFGVVCGAVLLAGLTIAIALSLSGEETFVVTALILAAALASVIYNDSAALLQEARSLTLLRYMAETQTTDPLEFLRGLADHPLVEGAAVLGADALRDFDRDILHAMFVAVPVLRRGDDSIGAQYTDYRRHIFESFEATHVVLAAENPLVLVALNMPAMAASPQSELELQVVSHMARLIAQGAG